MSYTNDLPPEFVQTIARVEVELSALLPDGLAVKFDTAPIGERGALDDSDAIARVRALHWNNGNACDECIDRENPKYPAAYPCPTIRALDGQA